MNFLRIALAKACSRLVDELCNVKTTVPWLLALTGSPVFIVSLLVPLRESLSMLPQLFINPWLMRKAWRRHWWIAGALVQAVAIGLIPTTLLLDSGTLAGASVLLLIAIYSLARSLTSLNSKELSAKTIAPERQGALQSTALLISGPGVLLLGIGAIVFRGQLESPALLSGIFLFAAGLYIAGAVLMASLRETPSETEDNDDIGRQAWHDLGSIRHEGDLRRLVLLRTLLFFPMLATPLLILEISGVSAGTAMLGGVIIANGLATTLTASLWGKLADHSAKTCLLTAGALASAALGLMWIVLLLPEPPGRLQDAAPLVAFTGLICAHNGMRIGRKTYVTTIRQSGQRNRIIAVSNTLVSLLLLPAGLFSSLISAISVATALALLALAGLAGCAVTMSLERETND